MDYVLLLVAAAAGIISAPLETVFAVSGILTLMAAPRKWAIASAYAEVGTSRIMISALLLSLANNTVFTLLSFLLGRAVSLLV
jgi:hypothetical protein